jgi:hypothetical protein
MFRFVTGHTFTFGRCSSSIPVRGVSVCCSFVLSRNLSSTFDAWDVLIACLIMKFYERRVCVVPGLEA